MALSARSVATSDLVRRAITGRRMGIGGRIFEYSLLFSVLVALAFLAVLLADVFGKGWGILADRGWGFVGGNISLDPATAGIWQSLKGSVLLTALVAVVAFPMGIGAAVYLEEYARNTRLTRFINTNIRNLAGVPSIVYGILGLTIFVTLTRKIGLGGGVNGRNLLAGGLTLAALVLPIVIITAAEALRAVPDSIREAGFGVGATRWEVVRHHVLPAAAPGILTGTVLTLSRAFGETAPLLLVGATTGYFSVGDAGVFEQMTGPYSALPVTVFSWARQPDAQFRRLTAAAIIILLVVLLTANAAAIIMRNRFERRW